MYHYIKVIVKIIIGKEIVQSYNWTLPYLWSDYRRLCHIDGDLVECTYVPRLKHPPK